VRRLARKFTTHPTLSELVEVAYKQAAPALSNQSNPSIPTISTLADRPFGDSTAVPNPPVEGGPTFQVRQSPQRSRTPSHLEKRLCGGRIVRSPPIKGASALQLAARGGSAAHPGFRVALRASCRKPARDRPRSKRPPESRGDPGWISIRWRSPRANVAGGASFLSVLTRQDLFPGKG